MKLNNFRIALSVVALTATLAVASAQTEQAALQRSELRGALADHLLFLDRYESFAIQPGELRRELGRAPLERMNSFDNFSIVALPTPTGELKRFKIVRSPIADPMLEAASGVSTFRVRSVDDPATTGRIDYGPNGLNGTILSSAGTFIIAPPTIGDTRQAIVYWRRDNLQPRTGFCFTQPGMTTSSASVSSLFRILGPGDNLKTYRLAMNATGEYTTFYGGQANAINGVITSVNRCNAVYEVDLAIRMTIVYNMCYTNSATDPFSNNSGGTMLGQNQTACDTNVGNANYDIGHVFSTGGGGVAGLRVVGVTGQKARGVTGSPTPVGDGFDIDYVAHEMGHQYGANHTFNGTTSACGGGNRAASAAYEPGSGSTIMAYAGICGAENLQPNSDAYFHYKSIEEIYSWRNNAASGGTSTATGNTTPVVNAGADYTIPQGTPFRLTATGSDANGDVLKYCWEQYNLGTASPTTDDTTRPLFRSFTPTTSQTRFLPNLPAVLAGTATPWEKLPLVNRSMTWRCTVRDSRPGGGGYATDTAIITVSGSPFSVTSPNTAVSWAGGSTQTVTWNVGGGSVAANVNILLSTNGGSSYGSGTATVLLANTPNDGSQTITVPNVSTTQARIIVEAAGNVFFDVSNVNFTITPTNNPVPATTSISPNNATAAGSGFTMTVNGSNFIPSSKVRWNGSDRTTTYVSATQLTASVTAADIASVGSASVTVFNPAPGGGTSNSQTFTINPILLDPNSVTLVHGVPRGGNVLSSIVASDNVRYRARMNFETARLSPKVIIDTVTNTSSPSASRIDIALEAMTTGSPITQAIHVWNGTAWIQVDSATGTASDSTRTVSITTGAGAYLIAGQIRVRITYFTLDRENLGTAEGQIDRLQLTVYP